MLKQGERVCALVDGTVVKLYLRAKALKSKVQATAGKIRNPQVKVFANAATEAELKDFVTAGAKIDHVIQQQVSLFYIPP